jgi:hypothetical protein
MAHTFSPVGESLIRRPRHLPSVTSRQDIAPRSGFNVLTTESVNALGKSSLDFSVGRLWAVFIRRLAAISARQRISPWAYLAFLSSIFNEVYWSPGVAEKRRGTPGKGHIYVSRT